MINKKDDDNPNRGAVAGMWDAFGKFLGIKEPPSPRKVLVCEIVIVDFLYLILWNVQNKSTKDSLERGTREKFDDYGREAKHRNRAGRQPVEKADGDIEGGSSPAISRESSSSELESLSSEDSDVAVVSSL